MDTIDVTGLPEPVAKAIQAVVEALRDQVPNDNSRKTIEKSELARELPILPGTILGPLTRKEIYEDVG